MSKKRRKGNTPAAGVCNEEEPVGEIPAKPEVPPLRLISRYLGVKDLLDCRRVNKQWSVIADAELGTRRIFMDLDKLWNISAAQDKLREGAGAITRANLNSLSERIRADQNFPFLGVVISRDNWVVRKEVSEFCQNFNNFFQRLYLKRLSNKVAAELLGRWFSNVTDLIIEPKPGEHRPSCWPNGAPWYWNAATLKLDGENTGLPLLERISIVDSGKGFNSRPAKDEDLAVADYSFVQRIVEAASSLKRLDNFRFWLYPCLRTCGKLDTITKLSVDYKFYSTREHYATFARSRNAPPLTSLEICNSSLARPVQPGQSQGSNRNKKKKKQERKLSPAEAEIKILTTSRDTLTHLAIEKLTGPLPVLAVLKTLWILLCDTAGGEPYKIFDTDVPLSTCFPVLMTVRICMNMASGDAVNKYFGTRREICKFDSVETLELLGMFNASAFSSLRIVLPNIKRLRVHWEYFIEGNKAGISDLWTCGWNLTELEIYGYHGNGKNLPEFEVFVTGITQGKLEKFRHQLNQATVEPAEIDALRTKPNIRNLTGLKTFRVFFSGSSTGTARTRQEKSTTAVPVAFTYALGLMADLQAIFEYDFRAESAKGLGEALAPYEPVVSIQHRDEEF